VRLDRAESQIRQLTGTIEQLQFRNQQLENQVRRMQEDTEYRFQELGSKGASRAAPPRPQSLPPQNPPMQSAPPTAATAPGRRGDAFDPGQNPNAPGAPHTLGSVAAASPPPAAPMSPPMASDAQMPPMGAPPGQPTGAGGAVVATLPPSQSPRDEYDLAYGYMLRKDYALAEDSFRNFLGRNPNDRLTGDATYWLGESMFQRQRYRDAAEAFLNVTTKFEASAKAPDALLRLGQSLAALGEKEAACASLGEVGRKFPRASAIVKQGVEREQKRARC
jgi:tol-pal system protein YbgF